MKHVVPPAAPTASFLVLLFKETAVSVFVIGGVTMEEARVFAVLYLARSCFAKRGIFAAATAAARMEYFVEEPVSAADTVAGKGIGIPGTSFFLEEAAAAAFRKGFALIFLFFFLAPERILVLVVIFLALAECSRSSHHHG